MKHKQNTFLKIVTPKNIFMKQQNSRDKEKNIKLLLNANELQLPWDTISHVSE